MALLSIQSMAYAQLNGSPATISKTNIFKGIGAPRVDPPTAHFNYNTLTAEEEVRVRSTGLVAVTGVKGLFEGSPGFKDIGTLYGMEPTFGRFRPGSVGPDGYLSYMYAVKGLRIISAITAQFSPSSTVVVLGSSEMDCEDDAVEVEMNRKVQKVKIEKPIGDDVKMTLAAITGDLQVYGVPWSDSKSLEIGNFLTLEETKTGLLGPGVLFPYFNGMSLPDRDTTAHVFFMVFSKCIGEDPALVDNVLGRIRKGLRELATSRAGMFLSHAYYGAELAIRNGLMIQYLVDDSSYHGFVLEGRNLRSITYQNKQYRAGTKEEIAEVIGTLNKHKAALHAIVAILRTVLTTGGSLEYDVNMDSFSSSRRLYRFLTTSLNRQLLTEEQDTQLFTKIGDLSYGDVFPVPTVALVSVALRVMAGETADLLDEYPAYLRADYPKECSITAQGLSIFGEKAPLLSYGKPKESMAFDIPKSGVQDPNLAEVDGKRVLQYIPFQMVAVKAAVIGYNTVFAQAKIRIPNPRAKRQEFTHSGLYSFVAGGTKDFNDIYTRVKSICDQYRAINRAGEAARKRKRSDEEGKDSESKKTKLVSSYF